MQHRVVGCTSFAIFGAGMAKHLYAAPGQLVCVIRGYRRCGCSVLYAAPSHFVCVISRSREYAAPSRNVCVSGPMIHIGSALGKVLSRATQLNTQHQVIWHDYKRPLNSMQHRVIFG
jgi:hypothetical protein